MGAPYVYWYPKALASIVTFMHFMSVLVFEQSSGAFVEAGFLFTEGVDLDGTSFGVTVDAAAGLAGVVLAVIFVILVPAGIVVGST